MCGKQGDSGQGQECTAGSSRLAQTGGHDKLTFQPGGYRFSNSVTLKDKSLQESGAIGRSSRKEFTAKLKVEDIDYKRLDVLVNSAATFISTPLLEIESEEWDRVMGVNLKGPHLLVREFAPLLRSSRGSIVNLADHMGLKPWVRYAHHSIAKAGLVHLTRIQAVALAPEVRVNAVAPGLVLAPEGMSEAAVERGVQSTLLRRSGTPEDLTRTVLFLVESPFITGQTIVVDGGGTLDETPGFY